MNLCYGCYVKRGLPGNLWDIIPTSPGRLECSKCGLLGLYVRNITAFLQAEKGLLILTEKGGEQNG